MVILSTEYALTAGKHQFHLLHFKTLLESQAPFHSTSRKLIYTDDTQRWIGRYWAHTLGIVAG
jgi:hypothetical protein